MDSEMHNFKYTLCLVFWLTLVCMRHSLSNLSTYTFRNYPSLYYKVTYKIPGGGSIDILMLDTITLCGNTKSDFDYAQPLGPASVKDAEDQWAWLDQQLALSEYV